MSSLVMPANGWSARPHQRSLWDYFTGDNPYKFDGTGKRASMIAHRRWGKDDVALNLMGKASAWKPATYWHMLPEYEQGRKAIWNAVNPHTGRRRIDEAFPQEWRQTTKEQEMLIRFHWGATWQVVGSDNFKQLVGTPPAGIVLSEWAKAHPGAWAYLSPILLENKGWALAITTPEGRNHAHAMHQEWGLNPKYFAELQTIEDSNRIDRAGGFEPVVTLADVEAQRVEYHKMFGVDAGDAMIEQEWFCSFAAAILGAYWGKEISRLEAAGNICDLDRVNGYPICTAWDIGVDDPMAIWVFQVGPGWLHVLDYVEGSGHGFDHYVDWLDERGYKGGPDWVPHDAKMRDPASPGARTRIETLMALGRKPVLVPDHKPMDRINAGRTLLSNRSTRGNYTTWFSERCDAKGLECLRSYKAEWDDKNRVFRKSAKHDWSSHGGDAWGHLAVSVEYAKPREAKSQPTHIEPKLITVNDLLRGSVRSQRNWD